MASAKKLIAEKAGQDAPLVALEKEIMRRLAIARREKSQFETMFQTAYKFAMPWRNRPGMTSSTPQTSEASDNFASLGTVMTSDFASMISDTFWPEHERWVYQEPTASVPDQFKDGLADYLTMSADTTFSEISSSNFYDEAKRAAQDLSVSAAGLMIQDRGGYDPVHCQMIPLTELLISRGPMGGIDFRVWEQKCLTYEDCAAIFDPAIIPAKIKAKQAKGTKVCKVQGCYRDYSKRGECAWISFSMLDDIVIETSRTVGEGSASIVVMRWDPDPCFSWGIGPAIKATPDFNELDETRYLMLKGLARTVDPPVAYDDDSVINLDGGIPNGAMIPRMKGSQIDVIESKRPIDVGYFAQNDIEHTIKRHYYLDEPEQEGKTPPTLGQWADESMRRQRRLGTPAAPLWPEFISESFQRFRYILKERGILQDFSVNGKVVQLRPINPLKRASNQDKAVATERFYGAVQAVFGGTAPMLISKIGETIHAIHELSGADGAKLLEADAIDQNFANQQKQANVQQAAETVGRSGIAPALANSLGQPQ